MSKYLDNAGLTYFWSKIKSWVQSYAKITTSDNQSTITIGNTSVTPATKTSQLTNDSGFITTSDIPEGSAASTTTPIMDGTASVGTELAFARGDHRHPSDTTKADVSSTVTSVAWDSTNNKLTETISGSTTDIVTVSTIKTAMNLSKSDVGLGNVTNEAQIPLTQKGAASGVCPLNGNSLIDSQYLPSYVDDVVEAYPRDGQTALSSTWLSVDSASGTVITPESGVIYVLMDDYTEVQSGETVVVYATNTQFRYGGSNYVKITDGSGVSPITNNEIDSITSN